MPGPYTEFKLDARAKMQKGKPHAVSFGALYFLITTILSNLVYRLSGYLDYMNSILEMYTDVLKNGAEPYLVSYPQVSGAAFALAFVLVVMDAILQFGMDSVCLSVSRGRQQSIWELFDGFSHFGKVAGLILIRGLIIACGLMLMIAPGVVALYRYRTAVFVMLDHPEMSVFRCLRETARQNKGHKKELFGLDLSFLGWLIVSYVAYSVPDIWVKPFMGITRANWYNRQIGYAPEQDTAPEA